MKLLIIIGSTRPGRLTERLAKWVEASAKKLPEIDAELVDLADYPLPFMNEPRSPRFNPERHLPPEIQKWVQKMAEGDAYIFVTPEYNHSIPGVLKNTLDFITWELVKKPATIVSHGTVGGARATMHLKEILSESRAAIIPTQVAVAGLGDKIDEAGQLSTEQKTLEYGPQTALDNMLGELSWYGQALSAARAKDQTSS
ncbi:MAG TPA: NAD(P)H-dependent oxidoreductase [Candidatus Saccharimonadales bacterium]|nr:NAD(P)H-dependent oxidoreductase [Candidatus Saccharimonadales bacterium]